MKYRHRTTGEIINVLRHNERGDFAECTDNNGKVYGLQANLFRDYEQVIEDKTPQGCAKEAVSLADALINELQKKGASNENN